jgi:hypothetical protein
VGLAGFGQRRRSGAGLALNEVTHEMSDSYYYYRYYGKRYKYYKHYGAEEKS